MITQVAILDTQEDAAKVAYGLRERIDDRYCKGIYSSDGIVTVDHSRTTISKSVVIEINAFVEGYRLALELA